MKTVGWSKVLVQRKVTQYVVDQKETARRARNERKKAGITQKELAMRIRWGSTPCSTTSLSQLETGWSHDWSKNMVIAYLEALQNAVEIKAIEGDRP